MKQVAAILLTVLLFPVLSHAVEIQAHVNRTQITADESVLFSVTINGGKGTVDVTPIKDFKVISRGSSTSVKNVNGNVSKEASYNYTLIPLKKGPLKIPGLIVQSGRDQYMTREIIVQVSENPNPYDDSRDVFVTVIVSTHTPYEGQQIIYTVKIFHAVQITGAKFQKPEFNGFAVKKVEEDRSYKTVISGREYSVIELNFVLIPLNAGELIVEPAVLTCELVRLGQRRRSTFDSFFDDPFFGRATLEPKTVSTEALNINVKPLPPYTEKVPFSGLVGKFAVQAILDDTEIAVGDSTTLSIVISGSGNIMDAEEPAIIIPETFKVYKDNAEEAVTIDRSGFSGKKVFRMALVPVKEGNLDITPFRFSYFDVTKGRYEVLETDPLFIKTRPAVEKEPLEGFSIKDTASFQKRKKIKVEFIGRDILPLKEGIDSLETKTVFSVYWLFLYLFIPLFGYLMVRLYFLFADKPMDEKTVMSQRANMALKKAGKGELSGEDFLSCLYTALISAVLSNAGVKGESLTYTEVRDILMKGGYPEETGRHAAQLLSNIESARYGGQEMNPGEKSRLLSETRMLIRGLL